MMKEFFIHIIILLIVVVFYSCSKESKTIKRSTIAMGTMVEVQVRDVDEETANKAINDAFVEISRLDTLFSTYMTGNEIWRINNATSDSIIVDNEMFDLLKRCDTLWNETNGAFDIAVGNLINIIGFEKGNPQLPSGVKILEALKQVGWKHIKLVEPNILVKPIHIKISFNACVPGYAADRVAEIMTGDYGINNFLVNTGGEIFAKGDNWKIGIQHPRKKNELMGVVKIDGISVVTSGDYEQYFKKNGKRYTHIFNPITGYPANECEAVTIIANNGFTADALSTGVFVMGPQNGMALVEKLKDVEVIIVDTTGTIHKSSGFDKFLIGHGAQGYNQ